MIAGDNRSRNRSTSTSSHDISSGWSGDRRGDGMVSYGGKLPGRELQSALGLDAQ
jgi:hypothetical protein